MLMREDKSKVLLSEMQTLFDADMEMSYFDLQLLLDSVGGKTQFYGLFLTTEMGMKLQSLATKMRLGKILKKTVLAELKSFVSLVERWTTLLSDPAEYPCAFARVAKPLVLARIFINNIFQSYFVELFLLKFPSD